jgi:hypothetical protein
MRAAAGDCLGALAELQTISSDSSALPDLRQAAERAAIRIITRFRLLDTSGAISGVLEQSSKLSDAVLAAGMNAFSPIRSRPYRGRWREAIDWLKGKGQDPRIEPATGADASFAEVSLALDGAEETIPGDKSPPRLSEAALVCWEQQHPRAWVERTALRARLGLQPKDDLGPRRIAEIFFEEGSLLALCQPERGARVLEMAASFYGRCQDVLGQRLSTIAAALAWARAGDRQRLKQIKPVLDLAEPAPAAGISWEIRLRFARSRAAEFEAPGPLTRDLIKSENVQTYVANGLALDLQGVVEDESLSDAAVPPAERRVRRLVISVAYCFGVALGVAGLACALFLLGLGVHWIAGWFGYYPSALEILGGMTAAVFASSVYAFIAGFTTSFFAALANCKIQVEPEGAVPDPNRPLREARTRITSEFRFPAPIRHAGARTARFGLGRRVTIDLLPATNAETYAAQSTALMEGKRVSHRIVGMPIHLVVDTRCAAACWEAILGLRGGLLTKIGFSPFRYRRTGVSTEVNITSRLDNPVHVQVWAVGHGAYLQQPWAKLVRSERRRYRFEMQWYTDISHFDSADIVHIICEAVEGSGGLELRLGKDATSDLETALSATIGSPSGFSPRAIARGQAGQPRLCVLQGFPLPEPRRFPTDRYGAGLMRRAAAELFDAGVPAVLVIPGVPEPIAMKVVEPVARAITRGSSRGAAVLSRAVREIQGIIAAEASSDRADALEVAFDVCLYCVSGLNLQVSDAVNPEGGNHGPAEMASGPLA